jgi:hypothetical protein
MSRKRDVLSPQLFHFASDYVIRKVKVNKVNLKINGTYHHHLLVYADDVNLLGDNILVDAIKKNTNFN